MNPFDANDPFYDHDPFADESNADESNADESNADESNADESLDAAQIREIERRMNINRLKNEANEIAGGQMTTGFESPDAPAEILEAFWENVVAFERAPLVTTHQKLELAGMTMPPAAELDDEALHARLWQIIAWLATQKTFLFETNHLCDRELYLYLRDESFHEVISDFPGMNCHTSPIGACGEADMLINFRYFADEDSRRSWMKDFPDYEMPPRETAPFARDHLLPQADYGLPGEAEWDDDDEV